MSFINRKNKYRFKVQFILQELTAVPYVNSILFAKVRLLDGGTFSDLAPQRSVVNHSVKWDKDFEFDCKMTANSSTCLLDDCRCRVSIRSLLKGGREKQKLGFCDVNLAEYAAGISEPQSYLLQGYNSTQRLSNILLHVRVSLALQSENPVFKVPPRVPLSGIVRGTEPTTSAISEDSSTILGSALDTGDHVEDWRGRDSSDRRRKTHGFLDPNLAAFPGGEVVMVVDSPDAMASTLGAESGACISGDSSESNRSSSTTFATASPTRPLSSTNSLSPLDFASSVDDEPTETALTTTTKESPKKLDVVPDEDCVDGAQDAPKVVSCSAGKASGLERPLSCLSTSDSLLGHSRNPSNASAGSGYSSLHTASHSRQSSYNTDSLQTATNPSSASLASSLDHRRQHSQGGASTRSDPVDEGFGNASGDRGSSVSYKRLVDDPGGTAISSVDGSTPGPAKRDKSRLKKRLTPDPPSPFPSPNLRSQTRSGGGLSTSSSFHGTNLLADSRVSSDAVIDDLFFDASDGNSPE